MKGQNPIFSHENDDWGTPDEIYDPCNQEAGFGLDAAATAGNSKCGASYIDKLGDALCDINWHYHSQGRPVWCNPPYSLIGEFLKKAKEESMKGATVWVLIPIRSDTPYFQRYVLGYDEQGNYHGGAAEIRYIPGRVKFSKSVPKPMTRYDFEEKRKKYQYSAPFPSIIVIFRPGNPEYLKTTPFIVSKAKRKVINNVHSNSEQTLPGTGTLKIHETINGRGNGRTSSTIREQFT